MQKQRPLRPAIDEIRLKAFLRALAPTDKGCMIILRGKGHTLESLRTLPEAEVKQLMAEASAYASAKLAEVETRAQFLEEIHGSAPPS